jgi:cell division transport system ATP-binding protein
MVAGYNLRRITRKEVPFLRRKIGIVFQDFQLLIQYLYLLVKMISLKKKSGRFA